MDLRTLKLMSWEMNRTEPSQKSACAPPGWYEPAECHGKYQPVAKVWSSGILVLSPITGETYGPENQGDAGLNVGQS
jgi:hypothetical protein